LTRRKAASPRDAAFFDRFRAVLARLPAGLIRVVPPAADADIAGAEDALGHAMPAAYASFLRSFDGADLFHESLLIAGVGPQAPRALSDLVQERPDELVFAEAQSGYRFALDASGRVWRYDPGAEERALAGTDFERWLDATVAREQILFGPDGEYAPDVFDIGGEEVVPKVALRQAERALKVDPGAAEAHHAHGLALARLGRLQPALAAFSTAAKLDGDNPWPWFDLGRTALEIGRAAEALAAFRRAAALDSGPTGARLAAWGARAAADAGDTAAAAALRAEALARDPTLLDGLRHALDDARQHEERDAEREAAALLTAIAPDAPLPPPRRRLPLA
jgi:tetratricopeptide (TPR) repeat protein